MRGAYAARDYTNAIAAAAAHQTKSAAAQKKLTQRAKEWIPIAIKAKRAAERHPKDLQAQLAWARIQAKLSKMFKGPMLDAINAVVAADETATKKKISNAKKAAKEAQKANKELQQTHSQVIDAMVNKYKDLLQANEEAFGPVAGVRAQDVMSFGGIPRSSDFMGDITDQIRNFKRWQSELSRGAGVLPRNLLGKITEMGPEQGEPFLRGLLGLKPNQRGAFLKLWNERENLIKHATDNQFQRQLTDWRKRGGKIADAILASMGDEESNIKKQMERIWLSWLKGQVVAEGGHGRPTRRRGRQTQTAQVTHNHNNNQITVHQAKEDLSTTLRKARLNQRVKDRHHHR
jgi:hypothetical protein